MSKENANSKSAAIKLSATQLAMLTAAARREDRCLTPAPSLRGAQILKAGVKLIAAGLVREVRAKATSPLWRRDNKTEVAFALKLTAAGARAIVVEGATPSSNESERAAHDTPASSGVSPANTNASGQKRRAPVTSEPSALRELRARGKPRPVSKIAAVIGLLSRTEGATLVELIAATGWLPHTTRAALTGLRKRGYVLTLDRSDRQRGSVHRVVSEPEPGVVKSSDRVDEAA